MHKLNKKYLQQIKKEARSRRSKKLFVIGFIGVTGVGKSYVAKLISNKLNLYIASNDKIRRFLNDEGIEGVNPQQNLLQEIAESSSKYLFENQISHIIDADLLKFYKVAKKNANKYGAKFFLIRLYCPERIILDRLKKRKKDDDNFSHAGEEIYFVRKQLHKDTNISKEDIFFEINTEKDVEKQVYDFIDLLTKKGVI